MDDKPSADIQPARTVNDLQDVKRLFCAYTTWLGIDLTFQDFATELDSLPGKYAPPKGEILLARDQQSVVLGCVALRPLNPQEGTCEMKRLFILPEGRGLGFGRGLVQAIIHVAVEVGYTEMRLDTLGSMTQAISLYQKFGFLPIDAYYDTPLVDTVYMAKTLLSASDALSQSSEDLGNKNPGQNQS